MSQPLPASPPEVPSFLEPLKIFNASFPEEALRAALARREEAIPHLIASIEWATEHLNDEDPSEIEDYMLPLYAMYLLAEMREPAAYRPVVGLARHPQVDHMMGDAVTEGLSGILAEFAVHDLKPVLELIRDETADEFARAAGITALGSLAISGHISMEKLRALIADLLETLPKNFGFQWDELHSLISDFRINEFGHFLKEHLDAGLCHADAADLEHLHSQIAKPLQLEELRADSQYCAFSDTISELEDWVCFHEEPFPEIEEEDYRPASASREPWEPPAISHERPSPFIAEEKTGRNDPCPCGSGKKYKKCCGSAK